MSYRKILVALDGSPRATSVLDAAVELARATGARLTLFRAVSLPIEMTPEVFVLAPDELQGHLEQRARAEVEKLAAGVPVNLIDGIAVRVGTPWQAILAAAHDASADLVVVGSHGHRALDTLLGTTAARVVNHADRAVLVVRPADAPAK
jgi:nucleotide-binding universal stress UspA family protein